MNNQDEARALKNKIIQLEDRWRKARTSLEELPGCDYGDDIEENICKIEGYVDYLNSQIRDKQRLIEDLTDLLQEKINMIHFLEEDT